MVAVFCGMAMLLGCGGSDASKASDGRITVHLVDGPIQGYREINVHIRSVEIRTDEGWTTLGTPDKTIDLLRLTGGVEETLASGASLPAGHYQQMRLILGGGNTVVLEDGSVEELKVPSGLQTGIKLSGNFEVEAGTTADVFIDFDAAHSIQVVKAGHSGQYILRPTVRAYDKVVTGSVSGTFRDAGVAGPPLAGVMVYAETRDLSGNPVIARSAVTDASGHYTLDLLPVGATYYIVSQPLVGTTAYDAKASGPMNITSAAAVLNYDASFTASTQTGSVSGAITPMAAAEQADAVHLMQSLDTGSGSFTFILRSVMATLGASAETYAFDTVPAGTYSLKAIRTTLAPDGSSSSAASAAVAATVGTTPVTTELSF